MRSQLITTFFHLCHVFHRTNMLRWVEVGLFYRFLHFEDEKMHKKHNYTVPTSTLLPPPPHPPSELASGLSWWRWQQQQQPLSVWAAADNIEHEGWAQYLGCIWQRGKKKKKTASTSEPPPCSATLRLPNQWNQCPEGAAASERAEAADGNLRDVSSGGHSAATATFTFVGGTENPKNYEERKFFTWCWCYMIILHWQQSC